MKLSIIVPVYNAGEFLDECVDSLLGQSMDEFEIILVNDGSTDNSQILIDQYTARYPERIVSLSLSNGGQGRARNHGIEVARGDYIGFVDSDDWVETSMFPKLCAAAASQKADVVVCDMMDYLDNGTTHYRPSETGSGVLASAGSSCNKLFRRVAIGELRFPENMWYEDFVFSAKMLLKSEKTVFLHEALYCYRCGHTSTTNNNNTLKNLDVIAACQEIRDFLLERQGEEDFRYLLINHVLIDAFSRLMAQPESKQRKEVINELRAYVKDYIPKLSSCESFQKESLGRRCAMFMNYYGFEKFAALLLKIKKEMKKDG